MCLKMMPMMKKKEKNLTKTANLHPHNPHHLHGHTILHLTLFRSSRYLIWAWHPMWAGKYPICRRYRLRETPVRE